MSKMRSVQSLISFSSPAFKMLQPLQTFGNTLLKRKVVNSTDLCQLSSTKKETKKHLKTHKGDRKIRLEGSLWTRL